MPHDLSDSIISPLSNFAMGMVIREEGKGSRVLGSGVLVSVEGRRGILTCGHVAEAYERLPEIGLIRFVAGRPQKLMLPLSDTQTLIMQSSDTFSEKKEVLDLAFTAFLQNAVSSVEALGGVFLNIEKNRAKMEALASTGTRHVDAMLGLIEEFSEPPFIEWRELISPMRAVLHTGHVCAQKNGILTVKAMDYNLHEMPKSFGGMSGGGLWRVYFVETEDGAKVVETMLCGIASWQIDEAKIACQGWDRIDQTLVPTIREKLENVDADSYCLIGKLGNAVRLGIRFEKSEVLRLSHCS